MIKYTVILLSIIFILIGCENKSTINNKNDTAIKYNIIKPRLGIYSIVKKDVNQQELKNNHYEKNYYLDNNIYKTERYNSKGKMTDDLSVSAITKYEYDSNNKVRFAKYYNKNGVNSVDEIFGYHSIEYIYDNIGRIKVEFYRDENSIFLQVPNTNQNNYSELHFLSPIITYEYLDDKIKIKAFDQNFNLLKEVVGKKPCLPFIDCGESE